MDFLALDDESRMGVCVALAKQLPSMLMLKHIILGDKGIDGVGIQRELVHDFSEYFNLAIANGPAFVREHLHFLSRTGMLKKFSVDSTGLDEGGYLYSLTWAGKNFGGNVANLALRVMQDDLGSLEEIFGDEIREFRRNFKRLAILDNLTTYQESGSKRKTHLSYDLGFDPSPDLVHLSRTGHVTYEETSTFEVIPKRFKLIGRIGDLNKSDFSIREMAMAMSRGVETLPGLIKSAGVSYQTAVEGTKALRIAGMLKITDRVINRKKINVQVTEKGARFTRDFVYPLEDLVQRKAVSIEPPYSNLYRDGEAFLKAYVERKIKQGKLIPLSHDPHDSRSRKSYIAKHGDVIRA